MCVRDTLSLYVGFAVCVLVFTHGALFAGCQIDSEGCIALAGALQGLSALQSINLSGA